MKESRITADSKAIGPNRAATVLGIVTGAIRIASGVLRPILTGVYGVYRVLLLIWMSAVAWKLYRLAEDAARGSANEQPTLRHGEELSAETRSSWMLWLSPCAADSDASASMLPRWTSY